MWLEGDDNVDFLPDDADEEVDVFFELLPAVDLEPGVNATKFS